MAEQARSELLTVRVTPDEAAAIRQTADAEWRPVSQWARLALLRALGTLPAQTPQPEVRQ